jgi:hypothetical protein
VKKRTTSLFLAKLLAATPLAFASQSPPPASPMKPVELAALGEKGLNITVDSGSFEVVILPRPQLPSDGVEQEYVRADQGWRVTLSEMAADFFNDLHINHRDGVVFWGSALLSVLALLI